MSVAPGSTVWGVRLHRSTPDHWERYQLGSHLNRGAAGSVYRIDKKTTPPLVAKVYEARILDRVRAEAPFRQRIIALAMHREQLMSELPFAFWPRRILFDTQDPAPDKIPRSIVGFTMAALPDTRPLSELLNNDTARLRITHADNIHIAQLLASQIARLHTHSWGFVFGDMSPNNIHVSHDYKNVYFIDTDGFQFSFQAPRYAFAPPGLTPTYRAPAAQQTIINGGRLTPRHDDFVLAIIIFQILMAQAGFTRVHPFSSLQSNEDDNIEKRIFPFANPTQYPVPHQVLDYYKSLPPEIQQAFEWTFTSRRQSLTAADWPSLLAGYRRGLQRKTG
jgi:DNA-binding helix-hairpin-helix protein with protein kinase domain